MTPYLPQHLNDLEAIGIVNEMKEYFKSHSLMFYKIEEEQQGKNRYLRFTVSIKLNNT